MALAPWLKKHLKDSDLKLIEDAVTEGEKNNSAQIIPMVVRSSTGTGHVPLILTLLLLCLVLLVDRRLEFFVPPDKTMYLWLAELLVISIVAPLLSKFNFVKRLFTARHDQAHQVHVRAEIEFYERGLNQTSHSTGILLFVSLLERRAVVLADKSIAAKLPDIAWREVVACLVKGVKRDHLAGGFVDAIQMCHNLVMPHFPASSSDKNEITNQLVIAE